YTNGTSTKFTITNGANGVNGATPKFKVENDVLSVSYDEGESWEALQSIQAGVDGSSIEKIEKTLTEGLVDTYTITLTDGSTTTFQVTNGAQGLQGIQGEPGEDGKTPVITIQDNYWYINGESTGQLAQGVKGDTGNGISDISYLSSNGHIDTYKITYTDGTSSTFTMNNLSGIDSIEKTGTAGLVDTYTITYSNGKTTTFTVTNGAKGDQGIQGIQGVKGEDGHTPVITIDNNGYWCIDDQSTGILAQGVKGDTGNGISDVSYLSSDGLVDTYVITYTNGDKFTFTIKNGADGANGTNGEDGEDGVGVQTAYIEDGYLYIQLNDGSEPINCGRVGVLDNDLTGTEISATYFQISGTTLTDRVSSITSILYMADEISVAEGATFTVCGDAECNLVFRSKIVELAEGENTFYIKVVNGAESKIYTVNVYRAQAFNVSFDTDGGSAVSGFKIDENETFEAPTTTKLGYTFKGWVTAGGEAYDFSAPVTADVSLTATWELDTYALSYDLAGGTLAVANPDSYNVHTDTITLNEPTRVGYVFDGWYEGETKVTEIAKGSTGAKSLVARWKAIFTVEEGAVTGLADYGKTLSEVVIPEEIDGAAITAIGVSAFANATFTVVTIPASVTSIGENAFSGCTALTTAYYLGSSTAWAEIEAALPSGNQALVDAIVRTGLTLSTETVAIKEDQTATVTATAIKEGEEQSVAISWVSNDTGVATVENGVITGISGGSTTITVSCEIEGTTYTKTITVVITGVERTFTANVQSLAVKVEQESTISVTAKADGAIVADPNVSYSSTSDAVATVDENGKVTAVSVGETTITATWAVKAGVTKTVEIPVVVSSNALTLSAKQYVEMGVNDSAWDMSEYAES
ncbi:MAG: InlB B-repeat-containing protein, partial [Clostridia bacterium]|nr:InlB B-repeat-containing protein [Clostridia bacterium]